MNHLHLNICNLTSCNKSHTKRTIKLSLSLIGKHSLLFATQISDIICYYTCLAIKIYLLSNRIVRTHKKDVLIIEYGMTHF